jgi:hypothetical protein
MGQLQAKPQPTPGKQVKATAVAPVKPIGGHLLKRVEHLTGVDEKQRVEI